VRGCASPADGTTRCAIANGMDVQDAANVPRYHAAGAMSWQLRC
jgi:hypothetical protein